MTLALCPKYDIQHHKSSSAEDRNYLIFCARLDGMTYTAIGKRVGLSSQRIREICFKFARFVRTIEDGFVLEKDLSYVEVNRVKAVAALFTVPSSAALRSRANDKRTLQAVDRFDAEAKRQQIADRDAVIKHKDALINEIILLVKKLDTKFMHPTLPYRVLKTVMHIHDHHYRFYK
jgi:hypothetical protein